jgi:hypothetical protein
MQRWMEVRIGANHFFRAAIHDRAAAATAPSKDPKGFDAASPDQMLYKGLIGKTRGVMGWEMERGREEKQVLPKSSRVLRMLQSLSKFFFSPRLPGCVWMQLCLRKEQEGQEQTCERPFQFFHGHSHPGPGPTVLT